MKAGKRRLLIWIPVGLIIAGGLAYAFSPTSISVDLASIEEGRLKVAVAEEGYTQVREVYELSAPVGGRLLRIQAEVGDKVRAGETEVARIEPAAPSFLDVRSETEARAAVEAAGSARDLAFAELERTRAELDFATSELDRYRVLYSNGTVPERRFDEARRAHDVAAAELLTAQANMDVRKHELERAEARLISRQEIERLGEACECVELRAPVNGVVLRVLQESETVVNAGQPIMEFGNPRDLELVVDLLSQDAVLVEPGQAAIVDGWGGPPLTAVVRRVEPYGYTKVSALGIEEQRVDVVLDLADPPADFGRLGHGYRVNVAILLHDTTVLKVPLGALYRDGSTWMVFVEEDGRAGARTVEIGLRNDVAAEVVSGLVEGQRVVLYPTDRVVDGSRIAARENPR
jgi:HlyD family secretion protein